MFRPFKKLQRRFGGMPRYASARLMEQMENLMKTRMLILAAAGALCVLTAAASAQNYGPRDADPNGYYSQSDQRGYYDRDGR